VRASAGTLKPVVRERQLMGYYRSRVQQLTK
jgi:hypothetical protein